MRETGTISIDAQNIMPIIKKWLYSDKDIFVREVVANASDAIFKRSHIQPDFLGQGVINVSVSEAEGWLKIADNGVGMTEDEVRRYINQVAFSSAEEFLKKYEGVDNSGIIGHFGLGFYSTFMVSKQVVIDTLSCEEGATPVCWSSDDGLSFEITESDRDTIGTTITMYIQDEEKEFVTLNRLREVLEKYCLFMPIPIYLSETKPTGDKQYAVGEDAMFDEVQAEMDKEGGLEDAVEEGLDSDKAEAEEAAAEQESDTEGDAEGDKESETESEIEKEDKLEEAVEEGLDSDKAEAEEAAEQEDEANAGTYTTPEPKAINNTSPLWLKNPKDCTEKEYKDFYMRVFRDYEDPLFWVHLNVDHPFRLKGILYFPKLKQDIAQITEGPIKLFSSQMFVADNIKEVIPEFLTLLKGVIDCPDLPLNVSRSFLQNDGYVKKLSAYITRKVADRLTSLFNNDRASYEKYWEDIHPFVKFGCMKDESFYDKVKDILIFKLVADEDEPKAETKDESKAEAKAETKTESDAEQKDESETKKSEASGKYTTRVEYLEKNKEKAPGKIYYATDEKLQSSTIRLYMDQGIDVVELDSPIDVNFVSFLEYKDSAVKYSRVDSDLSGLTEKSSVIDLDLDRLQNMFRDALDKKELTVTLESLRDETIPAVTLEDEQMRRYREMSRMFGQGMGSASFPSFVKLALNSRNPVIRKLNSADNSEDTRELCRHIFDLAEIARATLEPEAMRKFITRSHAMLRKAVSE